MQTKPENSFDFLASLTGAQLTQRIITRSNEGARQFKEQQERLDRLFLQRLELLVEKYGAPVLYFVDEGFGLTFMETDGFYWVKVSVPGEGTGVYHKGFYKRTGKIFMVLGEFEDVRLDKVSPPKFSYLENGVWYSY